MISLTSLMFITGILNAQQPTWRLGDQEIRFNNTTPATSISGASSFDDQSYNSMIDQNSNIGFYINSGRVFYADGTLMGDINVSYQYPNPTYPGSGPQYLTGLKRLGGYPELCIVPKPGSCSNFYVIGGYSKKQTLSYSTGGVDPDLVYAEIDMTNYNPLYIAPNQKLGTLVGADVFGNVLANPIIPHGGTSFGNQDSHTSEIHLAVSSLRVDGQRLIFITRGGEIYMSIIDPNGIVGEANLIGTYIIPSGAGSSNIKSELEIFEDYPDAYNPHYRLAIPSGNGSAYITLYSISYDIQTGIPSNIVTIGPILPTVTNKISLKGLEFSPNGNYIYATCLDGDHLRCYDANNGNQISLPQISQSDMEDFSYSMIESCIDGNFVVLNPNGNQTTSFSELAKINNPNTPSQCSLQRHYVEFPNSSVVYSNATGNNLNRFELFGATNYIEIAVLPDQIDGENYPGMYNTSIKTCCNFLSDFNKIKYTVENNATWLGTNNDINNGSNVVSIKQELIIKQGVTLNVENITFVFGLHGKLILEPSATLISNGCTFTGSENCQNMWDGIFVNGDKNAGLGASLIMNDDMNGRRNIVEHAIYGIDAGFVISQSDPIPDGGIINLDHVSFENNQNSIIYLSHPINNGQSVVNNCDFHTDFVNNIYNNMWYPYEKIVPNSFITAFNVSVQNIGFIGVNNFDRSNLGFNLVDCKNIAINQFNISNCHIGIWVNNSGANGISSQSQITNNKFINTGTCIRIENGRDDEITDNVFNFLNGTQMNNFYGVYLDNTSAFNIIDNNFNFLRYGVFVINSGAGGGLIGRNTNGNTFTGCWRGIHAYKDNSGLQISCNHFVNNITFASGSNNAYSTAWFIGGDLSNQGDPIASGANNEFLKFNTQTEIASILDNTTNSCDPSFNFCYYSNLSQPNSTPSINFNYPFASANPIIGLIGCGGSHHLMALANNDPKVAQEMIVSESNPIIKNNWNNELINWYNIQEQNDSLITYLQSSSEFSNVQLLFFEFLKAKKYTEATKLINELNNSNDEKEQQFAALNTITLSLAQNNLSIKEVDSIEYQTINDFALLDVPVSAQARTMLSQILDSMHTLEISTDTAFNRLSNNTDLQHSFSFSPNPANEKIDLHFINSNDQIYSLEIVDVLGRIQESYLNIKPKEQTLSIKNLQAGTYLINLLNNGLRFDSQKLIVENN